MKEKKHPRRREAGDGTLVHFEDADGHVIEPEEFGRHTRGEDAGYWSGRSGLYGPSRYSPCRVGLTLPIRRSRDPYGIQAREIAHEIPCGFDLDGDPEDGLIFAGPCNGCGRKAPRWASPRMDE